MLCNDYIEIIGKSFCRGLTGLHYNLFPSLWWGRVSRQSREGWGFYFSLSMTKSR